MGKPLPDGVGDGNVLVLKGTGYVEEGRPGGDDVISLGVEEFSKIINEVFFNVVGNTSFEGGEGRYDIQPVRFELAKNYRGACPIGN